MKNFTKEKNQETILAIVLGLLVFWYFSRYTSLVYISILLVITGLLIPVLSGWITWFWLKLSHVMGWVMSKVILSAIFYLFLFPIAFLSRFFKPDLLQLKKGNKLSHYKERNHTYTSEDLENPW